MRHILVIMLGAILTLGIMGCSDQKEETQARGAYMEYLQAVDAGEVDQAVTYLSGFEQGSKADKMMLRGELAIAMEYLKQQQVQVNTFQLMELQVDGDQAELIVKMPFSGEVKNKRVSLVKEGDAWKIVNFGGIK